MIHVSDISWTRKINHPSEVFKKGDEVEAQVLEVDKANQRIAIGIKQLSTDPWSNIDQFYKVGDLVTGQVTKLASFGASSACNTRLMASFTSRRSAKSVWRKSRTCSRPGRKSLPGS